MSTWGRPNCPHCKQKYPPGYWDKKSDHRRKALKDSIAERKRNGEPVGRPRERHDPTIWSLRKQGKSIRAIAKEVGHSSWTIQQSLKEQERLKK